MTPPTPSLTHQWTPRLILALVLLVAWLVVLRRRWLRPMASP